MAKQRKKAQKKGTKKVQSGAKKRTASKTTTSGGMKTMKTTKEVQPVSRIAKSAPKARTKSEIVRLLAESTGLSKREVDTVFGSLSELIGMDVGKKGPGVFSVPGLMKIVRVSKPATKTRKGVNPFTGEETVFKAKPARNVV